MAPALRASGLVFFFGVNVSDLAVNVILGTLVVVLGGLLIVRQRQFKRVQPMANLERILKNLQENLVTNRSEGKIQKVAGQLSDILINHLQSDKILFFRKQRRVMELSFVYGLKNIRRPQYRIRVLPALAALLTSGDLIHHPDEMRELVGGELAGLLKAEQFNVVFPIFWTDHLFGVYFIRTRLAVNHPLIMTFLLYLNQNLSAAYQIQRLESSRQLLEKQLRGDLRPSEKAIPGAAEETDENPGHLVEIFNYRRVDDLLTGLFNKVRAGLKAERLAFYTPPGRDGSGGLKYVLGMQQEEFAPDDMKFTEVFGELKKNQVYDVEQLPEPPVGQALKENLRRLKLKNISKFSLTDDESGLLFWSGKESVPETGNRLLNRLERIGRRALTNATEFEKMEAKSYTDGLTGLYNHRYFVKRLNEEIQRASRYRRSLGLMLFDIDDFKVYNDRFGHQWGDELLRRMGATLNRSMRAIDIVSRYGGDEFCIIMPEADRNICRVFMERLRKAIEATDFRDKANGFEGRITISIGSAIFPEDADNADRLIYCADMALLHSKAQGRNRSTCYATEVVER